MMQADPSVQMTALIRQLLCVIAQQLNHGLSPKGKVYRFRTSLAFLICALALMPVLGVTTSNAEERPSGDRTLKIGLVLPLSGSWSALGKGILDAVQLAAEDAKGEGYAIELKVADNRGELKESATAASRLIHIDEVQAIVSIFSGVGKLINPIAESARVINIGICSDTEVARGQYNFINYLTAEAGVRKFTEELKRRHLGSPELKLGIYSAEEAGFRNIVEELQRHSTQTDFPTLSFIEFFSPGTSDFRTLITRTRPARPDAILLLGLSPDIETAARQLQSLGNESPLVSIESFGLAEDKTPFNGSWFIDAAVPDSAFAARLQERYGHDLTPGSGHAYDTVMLLVRAHREATSMHQHVPETFEIAKVLEGLTDYTGVLGSVVVKRGGIIATEPAVRMIEAGEVTDRAAD